MDIFRQPVKILALANDRNAERFSPGGTRSAEGTKSVGGPNPLTEADKMIMSVRAWTAVALIRKLNDSGKQCQLANRNNNKTD